MEVSRLKDRGHYALGVAARHLGETTDAYRPSSPSDPLQNENRFLRLRAAFLPKDGSVNGISSYGTAEWSGIFDASYTTPGDYLVLKGRTFFIASQHALLPVLCVLTNRIISITRPGLPTSIARNPYGGYRSSNVCEVMGRWPACILGISGKGDPAAHLPTDQVVSQLTVFVPSWPTALISPGDLVIDDIGRSLIITGSELTELGWRLSARMATN